jgi:hypothetical protein
MITSPAFIIQQKCVFVRKSLAMQSVSIAAARSPCTQQSYTSDYNPKSIQRCNTYLLLQDKITEARSTLCRRLGAPSGLCHLCMIRLKLHAAVGTVGIQHARVDIGDERISISTLPVWTLVNSSPR